MFGYLNIGDKVATTDGPLTIAGNPLIGGEGAGYKATLNGKSVFFKGFRDLDRLPVGYASHDAVRKHRHKRTQWLVQAKLHQLNAAFNAPFAMSTDPKNAGYVCAWIDNLVPWSEWRELPHPYGERLAVVGQLGHLLNILHSHGIAHGDINGNNVCILGAGAALQVVLIDFGNFNNGDAALAPLMSNDPEHISPWLLKGQGCADWHSDVYALGIMTYEALLVKTIDSGGTTEAEMRARRERGNVVGDPLGGDHRGDEQGLPFASLSPSLQTMLRGMLAPDPKVQSTIAHFKRVFDAEIAHNLLLCSACNNPYWWHVGISACPCCNSMAAPPALHVQLPNQVVPLKHHLTLGRDDLPGAPAYISAKHLVIQPAHLGAARVFITGRNGMTLTKATGQRLHLTADSGGVMVLPGDKLELQGTRISFRS